MAWVGCAIANQVDVLCLGSLNQIVKSYAQRICGVFLLEHEPQMIAVAPDDHIPILNIVNRKWISEYTRSTDVDILFG